MAGSSGSFKEGKNQQSHGSSVSSYNGNGNGSSVHGEWGVPTFQHQQNISMDWTPEEQSLLEDGLAKYACESNIILYAKIALQLKTKSVRDVALRCRWMTRKEINKKRKDDFNARKNKDRKEKVIDSSSVKPSRLAVQSGGLSHAPGAGMIPNSNDDSITYNDINGATRQLLQQNAWAFQQISTNLASHQPKQIHEIKDFLLTARRKDARSVKIKRSKDVVKFKVRCSKYLYTLSVFDTEKADKLKQSLPPGLSVQDL
ncbi:hypothetical protein ACJIZ3_018007 [Penstemon smallii]|uniref:Myb-like domain-containing protein n=1 Tax=Penstemon smallii TaxID=265156 RepID=A0ABD3SX63_9LAMI